MLFDVRRDGLDKRVGKRARSGNPKGLKQALENNSGYHCGHYITPLRVSYNITSKSQKVKLLDEKLAELLHYLNALLNGVVEELLFLGG